MKVAGYRVISHLCPFLRHCILSTKLKHVDSGTNHKKDYEESSKKPQA